MKNLQTIRLLTSHFLYSSEGKNRAQMRPKQKIYRRGKWKNRKLICNFQIPARPAWLPALLCIIDIAEVETIEIMPCMRYEHL